MTQPTVGDVGPESEGTFLLPISKVSINNSRPDLRDPFWTDRGVLVSVVGRIL